MKSSDNQWGEVIYSAEQLHRVSTSPQQWNGVTEPTPTNACHPIDGDCYVYLPPINHQLSLIITKLHSDSLLIWINTVYFIVIYLFIFTRIIHPYIAAARHSPNVAAVRCSPNNVAMIWYSPNAAAITYITVRKDARESHRKIDLMYGFTHFGIEKAWNAGVWNSSHFQTLLRADPEDARYTFPKLLGYGLHIYDYR